MTKGGCTPMVASDSGRGHKMKEIPIIEVPAHLLQWYIFNACKEGLGVLYVPCTEVARA